MRAWFRPFRPFVLGILFRPVLLAVAGVVFAVAFGLGEPFGLPGLFWDESPWVQFEAGLGAGVLFVQVCFIGFLLDEGKDADAPPAGWGGAVDFLMGWLIPNPPAGGEDWVAEDERWQGLRWYLLATWPVMLLALAVPALAFPTREWPWLAPADDPSAPVRAVQRWPLLLGLAAAVAWTGVFVRLFHLVRPGMAAAWEAVAPAAPNLRSEISLHGLVALGFGLVLLPRWPWVPTLLWCFLAGWWAAAHAGLLFVFRTPREPGEVWKHLLGAAIFTAFFIGYQLLFLSYCGWAALPSLFGWISPTPAVVICTLLALLANVHGLLRFHFHGRAYFTAVAVLLLFGLVNGYLLPEPYPLRFPDLQKFYASPVRLHETDYQAVLASMQATGAKAPTDEERKQELRKPYEQLLKRYLSEERRGRDLDPAPAETPATWAEIEKWSERLRMNLVARERERLNAWGARLTDGEKKPKLVVVAVSGGAARSAYWTALVLSDLEKQSELKRFPAHVRVVAGASGGMVGAAHWTATLDEQGHSAASHFAPEDLAKDSLAPVARALLFTDLPTWPTAHVRDTDRGLALQKAWLQHCPEFGEPFRKDEFVAGEAAGWRPSLVFSPMLVEDGRRLLISNLYLPFLTENVGDALSGGRKGGPRPASRMPDRDQSRYSVQAYEFFYLFPDADDFQLGTAARMSAAFPYVSPAAYLPTSPPRRVVDAGYYDDYGVDVAADWVYFYRMWIKNHTSGVVLLQVRDESSADRVLYSTAAEPAWTGLDWLTGPLAGLLSARQSVMSFRNDEEVQTLDGYFNHDSGRSEMFTTVVFECRDRIEMNWRLTGAEQDRMKGEGGLESETNKESMKELKRWWKEDHSIPSNSTSP